MNVFESSDQYQPGKLEKPSDLDWFAEECDPVLKEIMTASRAADLGNDEVSHHLWDISDAALTQIKRLARAGDDRAIGTVIRKARDLTEEFSRLAIHYPEVCRRWLRSALTMPALLSPLPRVLTKYKALCKKMDVGKSQPFSTGKWDYHNGVNRLVAEWIEEILFIGPTRSFFDREEYYERRFNGSSFAKICSGLPPLSKKKDVQSKWLGALKKFVHIRSKLDGFELHTLPQFRLVGRRARVKSKRENARLRTDECWKEIARAIKSIAPS